MMDAATYRVTLIGTGPKTGELSAPDDGVPRVAVASPTEFGGPGDTWTPEHMFVASVSSCLMTTFQAIAARSNLDVGGYSDSASGRLVRDESRLYRMESVTLRPRVQIHDESQRDKALRLLQKAEEVCLISRSIASQVSLEPAVVVVEKGAAAR